MVTRVVLSLLNMLKRSVLNLGASEGKASGPPQGVDVLSPVINTLQGHRLYFSLHHIGGGVLFLCPQIESLREWASCCVDEPLLMDGV